VQSSMRDSARLHLKCRKSQMVAAACDRCVRIPRVDIHAIEVGVGALVVAAASGFGGAYLGAWTTTKHDRIERARTQRIEAADDLVQTWATALFAIDAALTEVEMPTGRVPERIPEARDYVNAAVKSSVRVDLLFGSTGYAAVKTGCGEGPGAACHSGGRARRHRCGSPTSC
jgi:hypothetical protein